MLVVHAGATAIHTKLRGAVTLSARCQDLHSAGLGPPPADATPTLSRLDRRALAPFAPRVMSQEQPKSVNWQDQQVRQATASGLAFVGHVEFTDSDSK